MNLVKSIHETAMEYSILAGISSAKGLSQASLEAYQLAFELEKKAALKAKKTSADELSRFMLLKSAAALALKANKLKEAEELITITLSENPPAWIKEELNFLKKSIKGAKKESSTLQINGIVTQASASENAITVENDQNAWSILVLNNKLDEIVTNFWRKAVRVTAKKSSNGALILDNISQ